MLTRWRSGLGAVALMGCAAVSCTTVPEREAGPVYRNGFEAAEVGPAPDGPDFIILDGNFEVKEEEGNRWLELPGSPLETYGVLFGPAFDPATGMSQSVRARVSGSGRGRRYPAFGVGLCGVGGYRLQLAPGKRLVELFNGEAVVATGALEWESGSWTWLELGMTRSEEGWVLEGKVWGAEQKREAAAAVRFLETLEPIPGKASVWGIPYSGEPVRFDDLEVRQEAVREEGS